MQKPDQQRYDKIYQSQVTLLPQIKMLDTLYYTNEDITLHENEHTSPFRKKDMMLMVFHFKGQLTSHLGGLDKPVLYSPQSWSFLHAPGDNIHPAPGNQWLETLVLGIETSFFKNLVMNEGDPLIEFMLNEVEKGNPFNLAPDGASISPYIEHMLQQLRKNPFAGSLKSLYQQSKILEILTHQLSGLKTSHTRSPESSRLNSADQEKLHALKNYIENNYLKELTLDGLARVSGLNTFKIKTGFKSLFSLSTFELIRSLRMQYAEAQLKDNGVTVSEIAYDLGYEHVQHFSAAFKKHFGSSPKYFKRA